MIEFFVSYRSADEPHAAALLAKVLSSRAGSERVFLDTASMTAGARFSDDIRKALSSCHTLLAIIGERWMVTEADGTRRIDEPDD